MIDCAECVAYANLIHARGEIKVDEIEKLALDRHVLKGCDKLPYTAPTLTLLDPSTLPINIICNGFSIKQVVTDVLNQWREHIVFIADDEEIDFDKIAQEITDAFAVKMRLKQGNE